VEMLVKPEKTTIQLLNPKVQVQKQGEGEVPETEKCPEGKRKKKGIGHNSAYWRPKRKTDKTSQKSKSRDDKRGGSKAAARSG